MNKKSPLVSIVLPVYGVEDFIEQAVRTLFEQTYSKIEYIFVDDCTKDRSIDIVRNVANEYPERLPHVNIIKKEQNEGCSMARKTGMDHVHGKYVMHLDPDDLTEPQMVESMVNNAERGDYDIVYADYYYSCNSCKEIIVRESTVDNGIDFIQSVFLGKIHPCVWTKIYKTSLFDNIKYTKFFTFEDLIVNIQLLYKAKKIYHLQEPLYHYKAVVKGLNENTMKSAYENLNMADKLIKEYANREIMESFKFFLDGRKMVYISRYGFRPTTYSMYVWGKRRHTSIYSLIKQNRDGFSLKVIVRILYTYIRLSISDIYFFLNR